MGSNFSLFPQYFQYILLTKEVKSHSHTLKFSCSNCFLQISRSVLKGPFDFEITRVDCICDITGSKRFFRP